MIFAIDFDGTIVESRFPDIGEPKLDTIRFIRVIKKLGHTFILYTMREGENLHKALAFLATYDVLPDYVNDNTDELKEQFGNNPRKIYADYYIDDHNAGGVILPWWEILSNFTERDER